LIKTEFISSGLLELYALGIASPEEKVMVEEYLKKFPELKQELNEIESSLEDYAQANAIQPDAFLKEKLLNKIASQAIEKEKPLLHATPVVKNVYRIPFFYKLIAAAIVIFLIESIILTYSFYNKYKNTSKELQLAREKMEQQEKDNKAMTADISVVTDKYAVPVVLNGTPKAPDALAKIFWMKNTGQVYVDPTNLPEVPTGKQYQLWAIVDGKPVDAGMIATKKGIYHIQKMKSFGSVQAFAITLEKAGGSPIPTMDEMIVQAKM
jgi:anti-sigma-K factor RskA